MKLIFITGLYPKEAIEDFRRYANGDIQNASDVFQWAVVDGLVKNNVDFQVISCPFLPSFPFNNQCFILPELDVKYNGESIGISLPYCAAAFIKPISICRLLMKSVVSIIEKTKQMNNKEKIVVLTYSVDTPFLQVLKTLKELYPDLLTASIVTDLPDNMLDFDTNKRFWKRIQCFWESRIIKSLYKYIDKFVLLSAPMEERIQESKGRNCIIEGIAVPNSLLKNKKYHKNKILLYTGTLDEFSGVRELVQAFQKIKHPDYRLVICGGGLMEDKIRDATVNDPRIIYTGRVSRTEALSLQAEATLLINPRRPDSGITRFSFPSKTMEYMMSGTAMMGYKLEGIPNDYFQYYYTINEVTVDALAQRIIEIMSYSEEELNAKAEKAYNFIMNNKTSDRQIKRMIEFLFDRFDENA